MSGFQSGLFVSLTFSVFAMTAVIWFVQLVTYPQFHDIGEANFREYHANYTKRISMIVIPLMLLQLGSAIASIPAFWNHDWKTWMIFGSICTLLTWAITFFVQVPQHNSLSTGYSKATVVALVKGNWLRTFVWTAHSAILVRLLREITGKHLSLLN